MILLATMTIIISSIFVLGIFYHHLHSMVKVKKNSISRLETELEKKKEFVEKRREILENEIKELKTKLSMINETE